MRGWIDDWKTLLLRQWRPDSQDPENRSRFSNDDGDGMVFVAYVCFEFISPCLHESFGVDLELRSYKYGTRENFFLFFSILWECKLSAVRCAAGTLWKYPAASPDHVPVFRQYDYCTRRSGEVFGACRRTLTDAGTPPQGSLVDLFVHEA